MIAAPWCSAFATPTLLRHESPPILERETPVLSFVVFIPSRARSASPGGIAA